MRRDRRASLEVTPKDGNSVLCITDPILLKSNEFENLDIDDSYWKRLTVQSDQAALAIATVVQRTTVAGGELF